MNTLPTNLINMLKQIFHAFGGAFDAYRGTQMDAVRPGLRKMMTNEDDWEKYKEAVEKLRLRSQNGDIHPKEKIRLSNNEEVTLSL